MSTIESTHSEDPSFLEFSSFASMFGRFVIRIGYPARIGRKRPSHSHRREFDYFYYFLINLI